MKTLGEWLEEKEKSPKRNFQNNPKNNQKKNLSRTKIIRLINFAVILKRAKVGDRCIDISKKLIFLIKRRVIFW